MTDEASRPGPSSEVTPRTELRASHEDRDRVVEVLRVAAGDGRLTSEELDERVERALTARTYGELTALTSDLPATARSAMTVPVPQAKDVVRIECRSGHAQREGRWVVPQRMEVRVTSGHVKLDFTEAVITQPVLRIDTTVRSGHLKLVTRPGIVVDTDDVSVRSGHVKVREPWDSDVPVLLRVEVAGSVGSGHLLARPRRRTFWQWLRRAPMPYAISAS
ncbi:MAG: DUF1707 domain-containing protein [Streptosporangiaceae bacterium]|nr:DUF1707 domain-containing protein [Streptosporangiaceae bacterium]